MLLRPVVLLLLCATAGMCATLAFYPTPDNEDGSPAAVDAAAAAAADSTDAAGKASAGDSPAAEEPKANSLVGENLIDGTLAGSKPAADKPEVDVSVADGAAAKKLLTDVDGPAGDTPALKDAAAGKHATHMAPSSSSSPVDEGNDIKPVQNIQKRPKPQEESSWSINSIRSSFQSAHSYFNSLVELVGGPNGVCQYRCKYGEHPKPRPGYQLSEPDGCSTSLMGFQLDLGIPAMTRCCNLLDTCYETCGTTKQDCDSEFRTCLRGICSDVNKSLGFESKVQACSSMADTLHSMVQTLGCRPYMNSQRAACFCEGEEKDEL